MRIRFQGDQYRWILSAITVVVVIGLLLVGLVADRDFGPVILGMLFVAVLVGLRLYRRDPFGAPSTAALHSTKETWNPAPQDLVPFGPYGGGQWTAHPIGFVIVIGFLLMGLFSRTPVGLLVFFSLSCSTIVGFFLWLHHR